MADTAICQQVKEKITELISIGEIKIAEELVRKYEKQLEHNADIYSIKGVLAMIQGDMRKSEIILSEGIKRFPYNEDLLFNMSYLLNITNNNIKSLEIFCKLKLFNKDSNVKLNDIGLELIKKEDKDLKIVHGTIEIANQMNMLTKGLKEIGINAKSINYYPSYLEYEPEYAIDINSYRNIDEANIKSKELAMKVIPENDIFHFHFGTSLTLDYLDLPLLKELDKKIIMQYWGSDVRLYSEAVKFNPYIKVKDVNEDEIKRKLEMISKYIPDCLVDYELGEYVKDYHSNIHYTRVAIDINKYRYIDKTNNEKLLIVHAPTSPEVKGTSYILKAIEDLKIKYNFDFKLVQGMKHEEAIKIYEKADIIIDQILIGSHGVFAVEAMAMGKPVICWISDFMKEKYPKELPIISANPDNFKEKLEYTIKNKDMLAEIGLKGRKYVEKYHDRKIISNNLYNIYKKL